MPRILSVFFLYAVIFPFVGLPTHLYPSDIQPIFLILFIAAIFLTRRINKYLYLHPIFLLILAPLLFSPILILADGLHSSTPRVLMTFLFAPILFAFLSSLPSATIFSVLNKSSIVILIASLLQLIFGRNLFDAYFFRSIPELGNGRGLPSLFPEPSFLVTQSTFMLCSLTLILLFNPHLKTSSNSLKDYFVSVVSLTGSVILSMSVTSLFYLVTLFFAIVCVFCVFFSLKSRPLLFLSYSVVSIFPALLIFLCFFFPSISLPFQFQNSRLSEFLLILLDSPSLIALDFSLLTRVVSICSSTVYLLVDPMHFSSSAYLSPEQLSFCEALLPLNFSFFSLTDSPYNPLLFLASTYGIFGLVLSVFLLLSFLASIRRLNSAYTSLPFLPVLLIGLVPFFLQTSPFNPLFFLYLSAPAFSPGFRKVVTH